MDGNPYPSKCIIAKEKGSSLIRVIRLNGRSVISLNITFREGEKGFVNDENLRRKLINLVNGVEEKA